MAVTLSLNPSTVDEGAAATDITVTASLGSTTLPTATAVTVSVSGGTATSGMDYPAISDFTVTIPANATSGTATLSFDPTEDILCRGRRDGSPDRRGDGPDLRLGHPHHHRQRHRPDGGHALAQPEYRG